MMPMDLPVQSIAPEKVQVLLEGQPVRKGMRVLNQKDGLVYKVIAVRPNGKITLVCKEAGKESKVTIRGRVVR